MTRPFARIFALALALGAIASGAALYAYGEGVFAIIGLFCAIGAVSVASPGDPDGEPIEPLFVEDCGEVVARGNFADLTSSGWDHSNSLSTFSPNR